MVLSIGNSHREGRSPALPGDAFHPWTLAVRSDGTIAYPDKAVLQHQDYDPTGASSLKSTYFGPDVSFASDLIAEYPDRRPLFVPHAMGATGFRDTSQVASHWNATTPGDYLVAAVAKVIAAEAAAVSAGYTIVDRICVWHNSDPDTQASVTSGNFDLLRTDLNNFVDYIRANWTGFQATDPIVIGGGMNSIQLNGGVDDQGDTVVAESSNSLRAIANFIGTPRRRSYTASFDTINPRYGYSTGLPVGQYDGIHTNRAGEITKGHLVHLAQKRARLNTSASAPLNSGLSFWSNVYGLWDFRSGNGRDRGPDGSRHLTEVFVPLFRMDTGAGHSEVCFRRTGTTQDGSPGERFWQLTNTLPGNGSGSYTKFVYCKPDDLTRNFAMMGLSSGTSAGRNYFYYDFTADQVYCGHANSTELGSGTGQFTAAYALWAVVYASSTSTLRLYKNGVLIASKVGGVAALPTGTLPGYLGSQNSTGTSGMVGRIPMAGIYDGAMTAAMLLELYAACGTMMTLSV